jgi:hypothetical protein
MPPALPIGAPIGPFTVPEELPTKMPFTTGKNRFFFITRLEASKPSGPVWLGLLITFLF